MRNTYNLVYDIETCPLPVDSLTPTRLDRLDKEFERIHQREPGLSIEAAQSKAQSLHPMLGWICCIGIAICDANGNVQHVESFSRPTPDGEASLLLDFWDAIPQNPSTTFVTFNGKSFDAPFIRMRCLKRRIEMPPVARFALNTHRWRDDPHWDLMHVTHPHRIGLADLCDLVGVRSPKDGMSGGDVAQAVADGRIADVAHYCEQDVTATARCAHNLRKLNAR